MTGTESTKEVDVRYDFVLLFDVTDGNPNGDPDAGNLPRVDPQTLQGLVTDVCLKRKIRNAIAGMGNDIYFQTQDAVYEQRILRNFHERAYKEGVKDGDEKKKGKDKADASVQARKWMCRSFYDVRAFGAVMSLKEFNCGQVRGPLQLTFARSIDPIIPLEVTITRKSVATPDEAESQIEKHGAITGTMGHKNIVPYALYRACGFVNPYLAQDTGFTYADLAVFFQALQRMFEFDRSASHGLMAVRGIHVFQHASALGEAPAHVLFDRVKTEALGPEAAPRKFDDYGDKIKVLADGLPEGVSYRNLTDAAIGIDSFPWPA